MINKILIVGPAWVGDMVMAQTLFKLLKQREPHCEIDVLAPSWSHPLLERMPEVSGSLVLPFAHGELKLAERYRLAKNLREKKYAQAIVLPNSFKSALVPFLAKIPKRTGWLGEFRLGVLNDVRFSPKKYSLMIERFMALGIAKNTSLPRDYFFPKLKITENSRAASIKKYSLNANQPILALCPGAEFGPSKRWPAQYYAEVARAKLHEGFAVWLFGSAKDQPVAEEIMNSVSSAYSRSSTSREGARAVNLCGKTTLAEAIDLLSLATVVVSNDSGLMHIAAALQRQLVVLYGSTSPNFTPPLFHKAKTLQLSLDCQPCFSRKCPLKHHRCMRDLHVAQVLQSIAELIS